jgi:hypothetical protein
MAIFVPPGPPVGTDRRLLQDQLTHRRVDRWAMQQRRW